jgi:hypothetical protein
LHCCSGPAVDLDSPSYSSCAVRFTEMLHHIHHICWDSYLLTFIFLPGLAL